MLQHCKNVSCPNKGPYDLQCPQGSHAFTDTSAHTCILVYSTHLVYHNLKTGTWIHIHSILNTCAINIIFATAVSLT